LRALDPVSKNVSERFSISQCTLIKQSGNFLNLVDHNGATLMGETVVPNRSRKKKNIK